MLRLIEKEQDLRDGLDALLAVDLRLARVLGVACNMEGLRCCLSCSSLPLLSKERCSHGGTATGE